MTRSSLAATLLLCLSCRTDADPLQATGTVEIVEVDVSSLTPARVLRVWRAEGDSVRAGDTLVSLTQSTAQADVEARRARVAAAEAQLRDLIAGATGPEIARAESDLRAADAERTRTQQDLDRLSALVQSGGVSAQQVDAARSAATLAAARSDAARDVLRLVRAGTRPDRIAAARAEVSNARAALTAAERTASDLVLMAPVTGVVMLRNAEPGEVLGAGVPAMTIGETGSMYARIYVNQLALSRFQVGSRVEGHLDGLADRRFDGQVVAINSRAEFTPRVALTEDERADLVFGVKVTFRDASGLLKPGLPITVRIAPAAQP
jgi:HlyD family secretion protein